MTKSNTTVLALLLLFVALSATATGTTIEKLYVIGQEQGIYAEPQLLVYSLERDRVLKRLPLEIGADAAFLNADGSELWVVTSASGGCDIVNTTSDEIVGRIEFGARIEVIAFTPDGQSCYVAGPSLRQPSGATVQQYNCPERRLITSHELPAQVSDLSISSDSRFLFYADRGAHLVGRVRLSDFERQGWQYVGFGPRQLLQIEPEGWLLAVCGGLDLGERGGGQITLLDLEELKPLWVFDGLGAGPTSMAISADKSLAVLTFSTDGSTLDYNVAEFELDLTADQKKLNEKQSWLLDGSPRAGIVSTSGKVWLGVNRRAARPLIIDLASGKQRMLTPALAGFGTNDLELLALNLEERIANLPMTVTATDSAGVAAQLLAKAYLHFCAGDANTVIVECQEVIDDYSGSRSAVVAGLLLAEVAEANRLPSKAAEQTEKALLAYCDLLESETFANPLPGAELAKALNRLANFDMQFDKESVKHVAERFLKLADPGRGSARFFFDLGRQLRAQGENKMADRCFSGARLALVHEPESVSLVLSNQLILAIRDKAVVYEIGEEGKQITLDGNLSDWDKVKPLTLSGPDNLSYGRLNWLDRADLSATLFLTRSQENIVVAGRITDADLVRINAQQRDKVSIHFDMRTTASDYTTRELSVGPGCYSATLFAPTDDTPKASVKLSEAAPYQIASERSDSGWVFELSLPLSWFGSSLPDKKRDFGLGIEVVDYDSPNAGAVVSAFGFLQPRTAPEGVLQPQLYGVGRFK